MNLRDLFESERKRVFEPDPFFTKRVMARLDQSRRNIHEFGIWEAIPSSARSVLALALILVLGFVAVEVFLPELPQRGMVEAFLAPDQNPSESFLYSDTDVPNRTIVMEQLIALEEQTQ